jgi:hypothetical protein
LRLAPGVQQYVIEGVNFNSAKPIDAPPYAKTNMGIGLHHGEIDVRLIMLQGVVSPDPPKDLKKGFSELEALVRPEDLALAITDNRNSAVSKPSFGKKASGTIAIE